MNTTALVEQLKAEGEDFEFYPTTREMVKTIWNHRRRKWSDGSPKIDSFGAVLDIGCGTCNFRRWVREFDEEAAKEPNGDRKTVGMGNYYVMEKSRILLDKLEPDIVVLGTDFHEATLIDKAVDTIFCNPPYREYEDWAALLWNTGPARRQIVRKTCKTIFSLPGSKQSSCGVPSNGGRALFAYWSAICAKRSGSAGNSTICWRRSAKRNAATVAGCWKTARTARSNKHWRNADDS